MIIIGADLTYSSYDTSQRQSAKLFRKANSGLEVFFKMLFLATKFPSVLLCLHFSTIQD